jgi:hypothetical protein
LLIKRGGQLLCGFSTKILATLRSQKLKISSGLLTGDKEEIPSRGISPNFAPALKKFSALFHEENFFEGSKLSLSQMLSRIFSSAKNLNL